MLDLKDAHVVLPQGSNNSVSNFLNTKIDIIVIVKWDNTTTYYGR